MLFCFLNYLYAACLEVATFLVCSGKTAGLGDKDDCRMLTNIPVKDYKNCPAVATSLGCLIGVIVPGSLRKVDTVFEVIGLQVMGITSVRSETDEWLLVSCCTCKRAAPCQACVGQSSPRAATCLARVSFFESPITPIIELYKITKLDAWDCDPNEWPCIGAPHRPDRATPRCSLDFGRFERPVQRDGLPRCAFVYRQAVERGFG